MSLMDFQNALKPEAKEVFADVFNIVKNEKGEDVDLRKMSWLSEYHKVFFEDSETGIEKIKSKFEIRKGQRKTKDGMKTIFLLERTDYWKEFGPASCDGEHKSIDDALNEFYFQRNLIEDLIKEDAIFDGRYFWKQKDGKWHKSWWLDSGCEKFSVKEDAEVGLDAPILPPSL